MIGLAETGRRGRARCCAPKAGTSPWSRTRPARHDRVRRTRRRRARASGAELVEAPDDATRPRARRRRVDLVVPSPLVRPEHRRDRGGRGRSASPVRSEIDLAAERAPVPIVAVTGTNGKTTVTTMIAAMLDASGVRAIAAGNIGRPLIDAVADDDVDVIVAEVSSFQLAFAHEAFRPRVAVLLAITPDHLDWHGSFDDYAEAKARIVAHQARRRPRSSSTPTTRRAAAIAARAPARAVGVSARADAEGCYRVVGDELVFPDGRTARAGRGHGARARARPHERARGRGRGARGRRDRRRRASPRSRAYATMPHRVALVGEASGVQWYDDSKATNPDATRRAVVVVRFRRAARGRPQQGSRPRRCSRPRRRACAASSRSARPGPRSRPRSRGSRHAGRDASPTCTTRSRAARRAWRSPATWCCCRPRARRSTRTPATRARGDDFAREVRAQVMEEATSR